MSKHTPGPWQIWSEANPCEIDRPGLVLMSEPAVGGGGKKYAACGGCSGEELEANAALIAAAPDLLAACDELIELLEMTGYDHDDWPHNPGLVGRARAAIAKATGEPT